MKFINPIVILIAIALASGISFGFYFSEILPPLLPFVCLLLLLLSLMWLSQVKKLNNGIWFSIVLFIFFTGLGAYSYQQTLPFSQESHYTHVLDSTVQISEIRISEILKPSNFHHKYIANVSAINGERKKGKVLVNIKINSIELPLSIDTKLILKTPFTEISPPKNPFQFNYASYLKQQKIYHQVYASSSEILAHHTNDRSLRGLAEDFRNKCIAKLEVTGISIRELAIIQALVLGQKRGIDKELYETYAAAGAIHILAVSGLHVGILYTILLVLFSWFKQFSKGMLLRSLCIVICLWCYALLTGLSPSVCRAVTMFSFFALAESLHRKTSTINTLSLSFISLLLYNPMYLFYVGFQLSYMAVLAILIIQPKIAACFTPKTKIGVLFWNTSSVTLAAQLGLAPISMYYFHQFPGLFFITNIVVLPLLGTLLGLGIILIFLAYFSILPKIAARYYGECISLLNDFITWVAQQDRFLFKDIPFSTGTLLSCYLFICCSLILWYKVTYKNIMSWCISIACIFLILTIEQWNRTPAQFVIFQQHKKSLMAVKEQEKLTAFYAYNLHKDIPKTILDFKTGSHCTNISEEKIPQLFRYKETMVLVLDSVVVYPKDIENPIVVLTQSTKLHLARFIDSVQPKKIIADGSNYKSYVERWKQTCAQKKVSFHSTYEMGAFIFE